MTDREGIFAGDDPFQLTRDWLAEAEKTEPNDANAMQLASVDQDGLPNVRTVLLKGIENDAFVFYTNYESAKGRELEASGKVAFVIHWKTLGRQIRVRGTVEREDGEIADSYYASRALGSRIGAHASLQSQPLDARETLEARVADLTKELGENPRRPKFWGGYRIRPVEMEFWANGEYRLHDRFRWLHKNSAENWDVLRLYP
ncbi:MAG: pyridoxamine 5'-phosphate oxidase [Pseudomonadota bacterium]